MRNLFVAEGCCPKAKIRPLVPSVCGVDASNRFDPACVAALPCPSVREQFGIPADSLVLGFVGRLMHEKGIGTLHAAWQELRERYPAAHLLVVGGHDQRDPVPQAIRESMQRDPRVHLPGQVSDTPRYYAAMDVQILPSYREGLPVSLLEGSAMALPLVASRIPGIVDVVEDGVTGTLVGLHDVEGYVRAVAAYFDDSKLRRRHGEAGRQRMLREFRPEDVWEANHQDYLELLGRRECEPCTARSKRSRVATS